MCGYNYISFYRFIVGIMLFKCTAFFSHILFFWWALSPNDFNGNNANVWDVNGDNSNLDNDNVNNNNGVRP
ncbi:MAG: hypothetical protein Q4C44_02645 [bacterium]|nr:hypothetical protein [bacterium]